MSRDPRSGGTPAAAQIDALLAASNNASAPEWLVVCAREIRRLREVLGALSGVVPEPSEAGPSAPAEGPSQAWLPDTFIERAYQYAIHQREPLNDMKVSLTVMEASAIRNRLSGERPT